jgi:hypothetical protein
MSCNVGECERGHHAKGLCRMHWERERATGTTLERFAPEVVEARFWARVAVGAPDECWPWLASKHRRGYGRFRSQWVQHQAHRFAYELSVGPIPDGLTLDHLCVNPSCVNPAHLEPVTIAENLRRGHERRAVARAAAP